MDYWSIALTVVAILLALYYYCRNNTENFAKDGIPFKKPLLLLGNTYEPLLAMKSFADMVQDMYNIHPAAKYVGVFDLMTPTILIRDPELTKIMVVKNFDHFQERRSFIDENTDPLFGKNLFSLRGERWKEVRNLLTPAFTTSKMKGMFVLMSECGAEFASVLAALPSNERELNVKDAFTRYTSDAIATCAFGISINSMKDRDNPFYVYGKKATTFGIISSIKLFIMRSFPSLMKLFGATFINKEIAIFFKNLVADTIKARDEQGIIRPDMIQIMMEHRGKMELTIEDMTAQALTFFFGGFDNVLEKNDGQLTYEALNNMPYLDAVVNEALRMYPVAVFADRRCTKTFELPPTLPGANPHILEPGSLIWLPIYGIQRDAEFFNEPDKFNPDRFIEDSKKIAGSGAYFPFGLGPRMCIGNRFALLETKALLFHVFARCNFMPCAKTPIHMKLNKKSLAMMPENGFWMEIQPRSNPHPSLATSVCNGSDKH